MSFKNNTRHSNIIFLCTGIIIGMLFGTIFLSLLVSYRIEGYHTKISYLESVIQDKEIKLERLEESINSTKVVLKDIEVFLIYEGDDEPDTLTLEKHIKEKYNALLGKEIKTIDIDMVEEVVDKRIMLLDDKRYQLSVSRIVLTEILQLWINISLMENS